MYGQLSVWRERQTPSRRKLPDYLSATVSGIGTHGDPLRLGGSPVLGEIRKAVEEIFRPSVKLQVILYQEEGQSWQKE